LCGNHRRWPQTAGELSSSRSQQAVRTQTEKDVFLRGLRALVRWHQRRHRPGAGAQAYAGAVV